MSAIRDISQTLRSSLPVWPGEPAFEVERIAQIGHGCPVNVSVLRFSTHAGTHADSPLHYATDRQASSETDLTPYIGACQVIDARNVGPVVAAEQLKWEEIGQAPRIIFRTYHRFPADSWDSGFAAVDPEVIERLAAKGVTLIGTDAPSLDPQDSKTLSAHRAVQRHDMRILEGLMLDDVEPGFYELIALPLKLSGSDGSPVRAVLREVQS